VLCFEEEIEILVVVRDLGAVDQWTQTDPFGM
jgi:hypothetical protein